MGTVRYKLGGQLSVHGSNRFTRIPVQGGYPKMSDQTPDDSSGQPLPLSGKISRIIQSLARSPFDAIEAQHEPGNDPPNGLNISEEAVAQVFDLWRGRSNYVPYEL